MHKVLTLITLICASAHCANYDRYDQSTNRYPYSTISNLYNTNYPYKGVSYPNDVASFPKDGRYPNYNPSQTTSGYNTYNNNYGSYGQGAYQTGYNTPRYGEGYSTYEMPFMKNIGEYCINRSPQMGIFVESLMGMWYGVEMIQHLAGDSRVDYGRTCIVVHIGEPAEQPSTEHQLFHVQHIKAKFKQDHRYLRLLWDEAGQTSEYALYFRNDSAGFWQVLDRQNGTMTNLRTFQQFSGTIQVLKAVHSHLVLNFCQEPNNGRTAQLYSVLLSRDPGSLPRWEIEAVHNMLQNKKLSVASRRMVCGNDATKNVTSLAFSLLSCILAIVLCGFS